MKNLSVPLMRQKKNECGPTALRIVLKYFGEDISQKEIISKVGGIKKYGVKTVDLAGAVEDLGFKVHCYSYNKKMSAGKAKIRKPKKSDIVKFLKKKLPVILAVRSSLLFGRKTSTPGHFIVITKYENGKFWYNDPRDGKNHKIDEEDLMFAWFNNVLDSSAYLLVLEPRQ